MIYEFAGFIGRDEVWEILGGNKSVVAELPNRGVRNERTMICVF